MNPIDVIRLFEKETGVSSKKIKSIVYRVKKTNDRIEGERLLKLPEESASYWEITLLMHQSLEVYNEEKVVSVNEKSLHCGKNIAKVFILDNGTVLDLSEVLWR